MFSLFLRKRYGYEVWTIVHSEFILSCVVFCVSMSFWLSMLDWWVCGWMAGNSVHTEDGILYHLNHKVRLLLHEKPTDTEFTNRWGVYSSSGIHGFMAEPYRKFKEIMITMLELWIQQEQERKSGDLNWMQVFCFISLKVDQLMIINLLFKLYMHMIWYMWQ